MLSSLRSKILLSLSGIVLLSTLLIMFFVKTETESQISLLQNKSAQDLVSTVALNVDLQYNSLLFYKKSILERKKQELKGTVQLAIVSINDQYEEYKKGNITEEEAKRRSKDIVRKMRYSQGVGYFWINDTTIPIPRMVMHPTIPELEGGILDDPSFNCAQGIDKNLFVAAVELALEKGGGYVDYLWSKPTPEGLRPKTEKLSYVRIFDEWNWVIGSGIYTDDVERDVKKGLDSILLELTDIFARVRIGESGYMYLFTGAKDMLIHPSLAGADFSKLINPTTGNPILDDLAKAAKTPSRILEYIWDKPPEHKGDFRFWKKSHVVYFEPLDWYIASSVYTDEIEAPAKEISQYILLLAFVILIVAFFLSFLLSRSLSKPLQMLTSAAQKIDYDSLANAEVPVTGSNETRHLGTILNSMLESFREAVSAKEELFKTKLILESRLHKAEKLESVGRLAAGIAHEINTPTQFVSNNIEFLQDGAEDIDELVEQVNKRIVKAHKDGELNDTVLKDVEEIIDSADWDYLQEEIPKALNQSQDGLHRISKIVMAMKNFSHPGSGQLELDDVNEGIRNTVAVASNEWKYAAEMKLQLAEDLPRVSCYIDELNQVILNMIINAAHAIAEKDEGREENKGVITISTTTSGKYAQICIHDTGNGMKDDILANIFDPFYTTKEVGKGSGQGLAIAHDIIVNKHFGKIDVKTEIGKGTTFIINLPLEPPA